MAENHKPTSRPSQQKDKQVRYSIREVAQPEPPEIDQGNSCACTSTAPSAQTSQVP